MGNDPIQKLRRHLQLDFDTSSAQIDAADPAAFHLLQLGKRFQIRLYIPDAGDLPRLFHHCTNKALPQRMLFFQCQDPPGQIYPDLPDRELIQHRGQDAADIRLRQLQAVDRHHRNAVFFLQLLRHFPHPGRCGIGGIEQHHKGLLNGFQLFDDPLFRFFVLLRGDVADGAVGGDHQPDGGMFLNDLTGADLGRHIKGDLFVEPGRYHHTGTVVLHIA